ncbi:ectonucleotide pyrophosphatase phosphodiesterase 5, partial [Perkinsus olseni]
MRITFHPFWVHAAATTIRSAYDDVKSSSSKVIMVSMDGFRWDYYGNTSTPNLDYFNEKGVQALHLINAFTTVTFPNHWTLVTGAWQETHGIVSNEMWDPNLGERFFMNTTKSDFFQEAEPIWGTTSRLGIKSVCINW